MTVSPSCNKLTAEVYVHSIIILNKWAAGLEKMTHSKPEHILLPRYYKLWKGALVAKVCAQAT